METNFDDNITNDYIERWLDEEVNLYFNFLEIHYEIIKFRQNKKIELINKNPNLKSSQIRKKINKLQNKKFGNQLTLICKRKFNSFLT